MKIQKRSFSDQEFDTMIEQLIVQKPASFDMLCEIADRTLHGWVVRRCQNDIDLCGRALEEDIMQEVQVRLIQKTVTVFLLRKTPNGGINRDPDGFKAWMFRVAENLIKATATKVRRGNFRSYELREDEKETIEDRKNTIEQWIESLEQKEMLKLAIAIVLDSESKPYIVMTWVAMCVFILNYDMTKIVSNHKILDVFFSKSLNDMFDMMKIAAKNIPWLVITQEQADKMVKKLNKTMADGKTYGETSYKEFFMKKEPLSTISDWENRMSSLVKRVMNNEAFIK